MKLTVRKHCCIYDLVLKAYFFSYIKIICWEAFLETRETQLQWISKQNPFIIVYGILCRKFGLAFQCNSQTEEKL